MDILGMSTNSVLLTIAAYLLGLCTIMPLLFSSLFLVEPKYRETKFRYSSCTYEHTSSLTCARSKKLTAKDEVVVDMLNCTENSVAWAVTDPSQDDNPLIFISDGFCKLTQYDRSEILNRNCRFLQGPSSNKDDVRTVREAVQTADDVSICLVNHKKDGTIFNNQLFICPLYGPESKTKPVYFLAVQAEVPHYKSGQNDLNIGWIYAQAK